MADGFVLNSWGAPQDDASAPAIAQSNAGGLAASPYVVPPAPPGTNVPEFRKETAKKIADDDQNQRAKAEGAIDFLNLSPQAKQVIKSNPDVFGPWRGSDAYQAYVRSPLSTVLPGALGGDYEQKNMEGANQVKSAIKQLSTAGLKAAFGGRITNAEMAQHNEMFGGLSAASADSATQSLERMEQQHFNTLQASVDRGLVDPSRVPRDIVERGVASGQLNARRFLPTIASPDDAARLPKGSMFVNPQGRVLRVP